MYSNVFGILGFLICHFVYEFLLKLSYFNGTKNKRYIRHYFIILCMQRLLIKLVFCTHVTRYERNVHQKSLMEYFN